MNAKPAIAIVGGIGSGKSEVAKLFAQRGGDLFIADNEVHELLKDPAIKKQIAINFNPNVFDKEGEIIRANLALEVFNNPDKMLVLESILHPAILAKAQEFINYCQNFSNLSFIILDIPLLLEKNWRYLCTHLVFIHCTDEVRKKRIMQRGWTEENWKIRENAQMTLTNKASICDHYIDNSNGIGETIKQVDGLLLLWNLP